MDMEERGLLTQMCQWLSQAEWCDVKLMCGGRSFNAHRAVLASVSTFLRRILLSYPGDETPYIVLPDFDLEAMSSVLYYIYKGEVVVQKYKLRFFLDIIQAMQIYIDCQYLPKIMENAENENFNLNTCWDVHVLKTDIFTLGLSDDKDQKYFKIKRGTEMQSILLQYSHSESDFHDNVVRCQNGSELRKSRLGNLKSPYEDRQRNSFLRDLFIETYPRNGNVNGLTESVLAISNERYRPPASVLSPNANGKHLGSDSEFSRFCIKTNGQTLELPAIFHSDQQLQCSTNYNEKCKIQTTNSPISACIKCPKDKSDMSLIYGNSEIATDGNRNLPTEEIPFPFSHELVEKSLSQKHASSMHFTQTVLEVMKSQLMKNSKYSVALNSILINNETSDKGRNLKINSSNKVIFNQVLENPWSSRKPNDYRPFRRKHENVEVQNLKVEKIVVLNDKNNNIQTSIASVAENLAERIAFDVKELADSSSTTVINTERYKCTHCNQVFTSSELLAVHMRRHSTNARYTCGECSKTFSQLRNFKYHMSIHRGTREFAATCTVCGKYFNDRGYLSSHMKIHRNRKEYKCNLCPKSFNQRVAYNMHVRIHTGVKPHVCEECGKAFSRKMLLKQHQRTHSGERPYACTHCDKRFADRSNMTLHLRLHTGVKPFSCSLCPKSFTKKHHLKSHLNFHTGSKPYSCPRCKLAFTQSSNMRTHLKKCNVPDASSGNDSQE